MVVKAKTGLLLSSTRTVCWLGSARVIRVTVKSVVLSLRICGLLGRLAAASLLLKSTDRGSAGSTSVMGFQ
jgi:hypothetical protein